MAVSAAPQRLLAFVWVQTSVHLPQSAGYEVESVSPPFWATDDIQNFTYDFVFRDRAELCCATIEAVVPVIAQHEQLSR